MRDFVPRVMVHVLGVSVSKVFTNAGEGESSRNYEFFDFNVEHWVKSVVHTRARDGFTRRANCDDDFEIREFMFFIYI